MNCSAKDCAEVAAVMAIGSIKDHAKDDYFCTSHGLLARTRYMDIIPIAVDNIDTFAVGIERRLGILALRLISNGVIGDEDKALLRAAQRYAEHVRLAREARTR